MGSARDLSTILRGPGVQRTCDLVHRRQGRSRRECSPDHFARFGRQEPSARETLTNGAHPGRRDREKPLADPARPATIEKEGHDMRTLRLSLLGSVIIMSLAGPSGAVLSQDDAEGSPVTHVTGTIIDTSYDPSTGKLSYAPGDIHHMKGSSYIETNEWSDPRLPADKRMLLDFTTYPYQGGRLMVARTSLRLDGPDGSWVGTGVGLSFPDGTSQGQDVLVGQGAYEGLFAVLYCGTDMRCDGFIIEGEMPQQPEAVPPAE
jgi:hypothetical protein